MNFAHATNWVLRHFGCLVATVLTLAGIAFWWWLLGLILNWLFPGGVP